MFGTTPFSSAPFASKPASGLALVYLTAKSFIQSASRNSLLLKAYLFNTSRITQNGAVRANAKSNLSVASNIQQHIASRMSFGAALTARSYVQNKSKASTSLISKIFTRALLSVRGYINAMIKTPAITYPDRTANLAKDIRTAFLNIDARSSKLNRDI